MSILFMFPSGSRWDDRPVATTLRPRSMRINRTKLDAEGSMTNAGTSAYQRTNAVLDVRALST